MLKLTRYLLYTDSSFRSTFETREGEVAIMGTGKVRQNFYVSVAEVKVGCESDIATAINETVRALRNSRALCPTPIRL
jgi:hypothetical protein